MFIFSEYIFPFTSICITEGIWLKTVKSSIPQFKSTVCSYTTTLETKVNYDIYSYTLFNNFRNLTHVTECTKQQRKP